MYWPSGRFLRRADGSIIPWHMPDAHLCHLASMACRSCTCHCMVMSAGVEDSGMQSALITIAVQLAAAVQQLTSNGGLFGEPTEDQLFSVQPGHKLSTKPWPSPAPPLPSHSQIAAQEMSYTPRVEQGEFGGHISLIVMVFQLFQSLRGSAHKAAPSLEGTAVVWSCLQYICLLKPKSRVSKPNLVVACLCQKAYMMHTQQHVTYIRHVCYGCTMSLTGLIQDLHAACHCLNCCTGEPVSILHGEN